MKICWDSLLDLEYRPQKNDWINRGSTVRYKYMDACSRCGEDYLTTTHSPSIFCSKSCAFKKRVYSEETIKRMSIAKSNTKLTEEHKRKIGVHNTGKLNYFYKGGVKIKKIPLYSTYATQLEWLEEVRPYINEDGLNLLQVRCSYCGGWFVPKLYNVKDRIKFLKGQKKAEAKFYCSDGCKEACPVYWKMTWPEGFSKMKRKKNKNYTNNELNIWSKEVLKRADYLCEYCNEPAEHAHHIQPKKLEPFFSLDPDNGIACCEECHYKYGHQGKCAPVFLASTICKENN